MRKIINNILAININEEDIEKVVNTHDILINIITLKDEIVTIKIPHTNIRKKLKCNNRTIHYGITNVIINDVGYATEYLNFFLNLTFNSLPLTLIDRYKIIETINELTIGEIYCIDINTDFIDIITHDKSRELLKCKKIEYYKIIKQLNPSCEK